MGKIGESVCFCLMAAAVLILFPGCPSSMKPESPGVPDVGFVEETSTLFVTDNTSGVVTFSTNDTQYTGTYGYTLWTETSENLNPFTQLTVTLSKMSGDDEAGYGVVFCSRNNTMLLVLLNTRKEYLLGELTGNEFSSLQEWTENGDLFAGYNQTNIVDIIFNSLKREFSLSFNGGTPVLFRDDEDPIHTGGRNGYIVVISPRDNFPDIPVTVTFKKQ